jgi:hypothetical protein
VHHGTPLLPPLAIAKNHSKALRLHNLHKAAILIIFNIQLLLLPRQNWAVYRIKTTPYLKKEQHM